MLRASRPLQLGATVLTLAIGASAVALAAGQADAQSATQINLDRHRVDYGHSVTITGSTSAAAAGRELSLQFAVPNGSWRSLASTTVARSGRYRFVVRLERTGLLRVVAGGKRTFPALEGAPVSPTGGATIAPSTMQLVTVAARFELSSGAGSALGGQAVHVRGELLPAQSGRRVQLLGHTARGWRSLAAARTSRRGDFDLSFNAGDHAQSLRVSFGGDRLNAGAWATAGRLQVIELQASLASWYDDGGATACGFHAYYGVANKSLPCGTNVTFRLGSRSVTATVDDRGPYVGAREWDLNQNTAGALGFDGVGTVWSSI